MLVAGTGTGVGKTWVACALLTALRQAGHRVAARKPVQSFDPATPGSATDAARLAAASGEPPEAVCPPHRCYPAAMAPPMAADALGRDPVRLGDLVAELSWPPDVDVGVVEAVGGTRSPLAHDGDTVDLARRLRPTAVVVVATGGLGAVHAVRAATDPLAGWPVTVYLNRHDPADDVHRRSAEWLAGVDGLAVVTSVERLAEVLGRG